MPNFSGVWDLKDQVQAIAAGRWTGLPLYELYAWGSNSSGQLGDNTVISKSSPIQIGALTDWAKVDAWNGSSAIKSDGTLWAWGRNNSNLGNPQGNIGDETSIDRSSPVQVSAAADWEQISTGQTFRAAVKTNNTLWTWGRAAEGQLGHNNTIYRSSPVQVGALTAWRQVSAGGNSFTVAVRTNGTLWSWGLANAGYLGNGTVTPSKSSPTQVGSLTNWSSVEAGNRHTLAIKTDGTLWSWGQGVSGKLGDGTTVYRSSPVQVGVLTNWTQAAAGGNHSAAIKTDGTLWTWGRAQEGQLGNGFGGLSQDKSSPVQIGALTDWSQVTTGYNHTAAVRANGTLWGWGSNNQGQIGQNTTVNRSSPVQIGSLTGWLQVAAGSSHTLAIFQGTTN